jgi:DnaJ-class molecular chaperone
MKVNSFDSALEKGNVETHEDLIEYMLTHRMSPVILRSFALRRAFKDHEITPELRLFVKAMCSSGNTNGAENKLLRAIQSRFPELGLRGHTSTCTLCKGVGKQTGKWYNRVGSPQTYEYHCRRCAGTGKTKGWTCGEELQDQG